MFNIINYQGNANQNYDKISTSPVRMAIVKKRRNNKCWGRCVEKGTLMYWWWECKLLQSLWKVVWIFIKKLRIETGHIT